MARELKVFGTTVMASGDEAQALGLNYGNGNRQVRAIVAATTRVDAAKAFGMSVSQANGFMSATGNTVELETALAKPGQVFACRMDDHKKATFIEITRKEYVSYKRPKRQTYEEMVALREKNEAERRARTFTVEELEYMVEMFGQANSPTALAIAEKARLHLKIA